MTNIVRKELESRLKAFALSRTPALAVSYEDASFVKPSALPFLECFLLPASTVNPTVSATRTRQRGIFQINVWCPSGKGTVFGDDIVQAIINYFPVIPKTGNVSVEETPNAEKAITDISGWRVIPVTIKYRHEGVT